MFRLTSNKKGHSLHPRTLVLAFCLTALPVTGTAAETVASPANPGLQQLLEQQGWVAQTQADGSTVYLPPVQKSGDSTDGPADSTAPQTSPDTYEQLRESGWGVRTDSDGNTLLIPPERKAGAPAMKGDPAPLELVEGAVGTTVESKAIVQPELKSLLMERGWRVETDASGSTVLLPVQPGTPSTQADESEKTEHTGSNAESAEAAAPFSRFQQSLRQKGWRVEPAADGAVLVYPPQAAGSKDIYRADATPSQRGQCAGVLLASVSNGEIALPINSQGKAERLAMDWIAHFGGPKHTVGKIRRINRLFAVSIVEKKPPFRLRNQLIIRQDSGQVIAVD